MNTHFQHVINAMLKNYSFKKENLSSLHGLNNQATKVCMEHHYADLLAGVGKLAGAAEAAGDYESMDEINQLFHKILTNEIPAPLNTGA
ncbi:Uncharacterised protein [Edwardsiella tarda]|uniref:Uncharacterized protein n=1 Tax=Edwardsiella tarda ATCC 15947 = NBRC 105688 TaxID=667121 RepID=A0AC61THS3_EDWTA|nr:hypothetical protein [Edwardsiella tarda]UAL56669.1 hypothetical protein K8O98_01435 [Edwardsiella tarda]UCQ00278.1 hypothetical protein DCL27_00230 [Edwardsiella tarda ATCC 15947 = NBRC 105688]STD27873.1 Uncharacterised protein [Edwardsiella tarda]